MVCEADIKGFLPTLPLAYAGRWRGVGHNRRDTIGALNKGFFAMQPRHILRVLFLLTLAAGLVGCGQKGPLRLPDAPKAISVDGAN
jgi:predicted small lipoprotein YifL